MEIRAKNAMEKSFFIGQPEVRLPGTSVSSL